MTDFRVPPLPDEYEAMYWDSVKEMKATVMKIRGTQGAQRVRGLTD